MISVRRAFTGYTTTAIWFQREIAGSYDQDNNWIAGGFTDSVTIYATPLPFGNREDGVLGDQLQPTISGERIPSYFNITCPQELPINSYLTFYGQTYKVIRDAKYNDAGYWSTLGERVDDKIPPVGFRFTDTGLEAIT